MFSMGNPRVMILPEADRTGARYGLPTSTPSWKVVKGLPSMVMVLSPGVYCTCAERFRGATRQRAAKNRMIIALYVIPETRRSPAPGARIRRCPGAAPHLAD